MEKKKNTLRSTSAIDIYLGQALRKKRLNLGISQCELAEVVGVTFQQIQKYEKGANRITVGNFYKMIRFLELDANELFGSFEEYSAIGDKKIYNFIFTMDEDSIEQSQKLAA